MTMGQQAITEFLLVSQTNKLPLTVVGLPVQINIIKNRIRDTDQAAEVPVTGVGQIESEPIN